MVGEGGASPEGSAIRQRRGGRRMIRSAPRSSVAVVGDSQRSSRAGPTKARSPSCPFGSLLGSGTRDHGSHRPLFMFQSRETDRVDGDACRY